MRAYGNGEREQDDGNSITAQSLPRSKRECAMDLISAGNTLESVASVFGMSVGCADACLRLNLGRRTLVARNKKATARVAFDSREIWN
jgi:hypothetical protein